MTYLDYNDAIFSVQFVDVGNLPQELEKEPIRNGYIFTGWKEIAENVYQAEYVKQHKVTFVYYDDTLQAQSSISIFVNDNDKIPANKIPVPGQEEGFTFKGWNWDVNESVVADLEIVALYERVQFKVSFFDGYGQEIESIMTGYGFAPTVPLNTPAYYCDFGSGNIANSRVYTFSGWKDENGSFVDVQNLEVTQNMNLYAAYETNDFTEPVMAVIIDGNTVVIEIYCSTRIYALNFGIDYNLDGNDYVAIEKVTDLETSSANSCITDDGFYDYNNKTCQFLLRGQIKTALILVLWYIT